MFTPYLIVKFIHIAGALGIFAAIAIEWVCLLNLQSAESTVNAKQWIKIGSRLHRIHVPSWILILASGIYMMATVWRHQDWVTVTFVLIILMIVLGAVLSGKRFKAIGMMLEQSGQTGLSAELQNKLNDPALIYSLSIRTLIALNIILLMTIKPGLAGALASSFITIIIGVMIRFLFVKTAARKKLIGEFE
jgi:hypothetical protein